MGRKKKVIRAEWPRIYWTPKDGKLVLCVDSRKTGFAKGGRQFWHSEAEALACAEQIARQKENEGASSFAELSPPQRRDAAEALAPSGWRRNTFGCLHCLHARAGAPGEDGAYSHRR